MTPYPAYPAYKNSGVEWLGKVPRGWEIKRLAAIGRFSKGGGFSKADLTSEGERAFLYGDIYTRYGFSVAEPSRYISVTTCEKAVKASPGDLLFAGSGEDVAVIGKCVAYTGSDEVAIGGDVIIFSPRKSDSRFLSYLVNSNGVNFEKSRSSKGEIIVHTYGSKLREIRCPYPTPAEQTAIADFLDDKTAKINKAIAQKQQLIALLKERKQIIIQNAVTKGLDPNVKMKDSGIEWIGEIPEHWRIKKLKHLGRIIGFSLDDSFLCSPEDPDAVMPYFKVDDLNHVEEQFRLFYAKTAVKRRGSKIVFERGLMLFPKRGAAIGTNKIAITATESCFDPNLMGFKVDESKLSPVYLATILQTRGLLELADTNTIPQINNKRIYPLEIEVPDMQEQVRILDFIRRANELFARAISSETIQIQKLRECRATLIDSSVTGKIKVPGI